MSTQPAADWNKSGSDKALGDVKEELARLQEVLFAAADQSLLVVLQGLDGSGKDSTIREVFSGMDPAGVRVVSFKKPTPEEAAHDFLWRVHREVPRKRFITVFNRSHYEEAVLPMVYGKKTLEDIQPILSSINDFEHLLQRHGKTTIVKVFLHVSEAYQHERMLRRRTDPQKIWKYDPADEGAIAIRSTFLGAWEGILAATETVAPWHVVPGDDKKYRRLRLAEIVRDALLGMNLAYPTSNTSNL